MLLDNWQNVQNILVIQSGSDCSQTQILPTLEKLRQLQPNAFIVLIGSSHKINSYSSWVDEVFVHEEIGTKFVNPEHELALIYKLCQRGFDAAIICTEPGESPYSLAYICYLAGIPIRIGRSQEFGGSLLSQ
ncbi:glycosyltransferase family 9 protein [Scytonema sp. NUACC26]|uniref:glycosyltransferase family 9 protein n=1 Tax=Scytonema sp. NUACC26 TaxID=3140176 RepID=UPI0034DBFB61